MSTLFASNFTAADNTNVLSISQSPYLNFLADFSDNFRTTSNRARRTAGTGGSGFIRTQEAFPSIGYLATFRILRPAAGSADIFRVRVSGTDRNNAYGIAWASGNLTLSRLVGGTPTTIGGSALSLAWGAGVTRDIGLRFNTSTNLVEMLVDGVVQRSGTDTTYTNAGQVRINTDGEVGDDATTTGFQFESVIVESIEGGSPSNAPRSQFYHLQGMR